MHLLTGGRDQGDSYSLDKVHKIIMIKENATPHRWWRPRWWCSSEKVHKIIMIWLCVEAWVREMLVWQYLFYWSYFPLCTQQWPIGSRHKPARSRICERLKVLKCKSLMSWILIIFYHEVSIGRGLEGWNKILHFLQMGEILAILF